MCTLPEPRRLPGDLAMWFFILAELSVFAILILAFAVTQVLKPEVFAEGRAQLDTSTGLAMTLSLLTAGLLAALALQQVRLQRWRRGAGLFVAALLVALVYVAIKLTEYAHLGAAGIAQHVAHAHVEDVLEDLAVDPRAGADGNAAQHELRIEPIAAFLEVTAVGHLRDDLGLEALDVCGRGVFHHGFLRARRSRRCRLDDLFLLVVIFRVEQGDVGPQGAAKPVGLDTCLEGLDRLRS